MRKGLCELGEMQEDSEKPQDLTNNNWLSFMSCIVCMFAHLFYPRVPTWAQERLHTWKHQQAQTKKTKHQKIKKQKPGISCYPGLFGQSLGKGNPTETQREVSAPVLQPRVLTHRPRQQQSPGQCWFLLQTEVRTGSLICP